MNRNISENRWTTNDEITFVKHLGSWSNKGLTKNRLSVLQRYYKNILSRDSDKYFNVAKVAEVAIAEMAKEREAIINGTF